MSAMRLPEFRAISASRPPKRRSISRGTAGLGAITTRAGRGAGSIAWAGLFNTYFWLDPTRRVTGTIMTQLLPFADERVLKLFAEFESGLYKAVESA